MVGSHDGIFVCESYFGLKSVVVFGFCFYERPFDSVGEFIFVEEDVSFGYLCCFFGFMG